MSERLLTSNEIVRLKAAGIEYPWTPWQSLALLDEIERLNARLDVAEADLRDIRADLTADQHEQLAGAENQNQVIAELKAEVERLQRAQSNSTDRDYALMAEERDQAHDSESALRARVAELEAALREYGIHRHSNCNSPIYPPSGLSKDVIYRPCECGLDAALAPAKEKP